MKKNRVFPTVLLLIFAISTVFFCNTTSADQGPITVKKGDKAPEWSGPDSNPTSPTFEKTIAIKDLKGKPSVWIVTFDCAC